MSSSIDCQDVTASDANQALVAAFWRYESALMSNDVAALDDLFLNSDETIRADHVAVLLGHDAIARYRAARTTGAPARTIVDVHIRTLSDDTSVVLAETCRPNGARGLQTQVWTNTDEGWKVAYAHVSAGAPRDATIWRKVGAPLVAATAEGTLSGMSVAVKDLFAIAGEPIGGGVPQYLEQAPIETANAHAVAALIDHGATVIGLAHTDELAYSLGGTNPHYGTPPNAAAPERIPGGSSSGPSAAVSSREVDLGLGTDTAGSVRVPASYQGIYGLRPTHGVIDSAGVLPLAPSFDTVGLLARDIDTLTRAADVLLPSQPIVGIETLIVDPTLLGFAEPEVAQSFWSAVEALRGHVAVEYRDVICGRIEGWFTAFRTLQAYEAWQVHGEFLTRHPDALRSDAASRFITASTVTAHDAETAGTVLVAAREAIDSALPPTTALLLPSAAGPAPLRSAGSAERARVATLHLTCLASLSGRPAISAPLLQAEGAPVGLCAVGSPAGDRSLLRFALDHLTSR
jgi:Asp-tRNA(Asn)/Glu-tRNA(Gln) amidotransferase A subunit family amidase